MIKKLSKDAKGDYIFPDISDLLPQGKFPIFTKWLQDKAIIYKQDILEKKPSPSKEEERENLERFLALLKKTNNQLSHYYWPPDNNFHCWLACGGLEFTEIRKRLARDLFKLIEIGNDVSDHHRINNKKYGRPNKLSRDVDLYMVYQNLIFAQLDKRKAAFNANEILSRYGYDAHGDTGYIKDFFDNIKRSIRKGKSFCQEYNVFQEKQDLQILKDM